MCRFFPFCRMDMLETYDKDLGCWPTIFTALTCWIAEVHFLEADDVAKEVSQLIFFLHHLRRMSDLSDIMR